MSDQFCCYWDDSGTDPGTEAKSKADKDILLVGGYFAHEDEWKDFAGRWKPILDDFDLREFHMVAFANMRYPYSKLEKEGRAEPLMQQLLDVIADCARAYVAWAIEIDAYMEIIKARNLLEKDIVRAYHICARKCLETVSDWARVAGYRQKVLHVFDGGNAAWPTFDRRLTQEHLSALNILRPTDQVKRDVLPLQAADILANQVCKGMLVSSGRSRPPIRIYTKRLFGKPGIQKIMGLDEVRERYREELWLDDVVAHGKAPRRISVRPIPQENVTAVKALFVRPEEYEISKAIRSLQ